MIGRFLQALVFVWSVLASITSAQQLPDLRTPEGIDAFTQTYYQHPRPDRIPTLIDALNSTGLLQKPSAIPPYVGFFSEVFSGNPDKLPQWQALIDKQDAHIKAALERAVALSKAGGVLTLRGHSAELNDMYWGAFFASGDSSFTKKLVDQLRYCDERNDLQLFMTGISAKWSLASNAQSHAVVALDLETEKGNNPDKRIRELIAELLVQGPARVKQEAAEVIRRQREAGKWR
jgi:hypothetical protein